LISPPPSRLISLSTLSHKKEDTVGKRARSLGTSASEPAYKKPPQNDLVGDPNSAPPAQEASQAIRGQDQDKEKEIEDEVRRSCLLTLISDTQTSSPSRDSRSACTTSSFSVVTTTGQNTWRTQKKTRNKRKAPTADEHFQELAKDIHESNKNISNPYEHNDAEQYNWAFDKLMSDEKKDLVKRAKRLIGLIKAKDPPKNYIARRTSKLQGEARDWNEGKSVKEYDEDAVCELEQFIDDLSMKNADKHIVGYYEDKVGTYKNINFSDGSGGQGSF
jgi:hypothetical protein